MVRAKGCNFSQGGVEPVNHSVGTHELGYHRFYYVILLLGGSSQDLDTWLRTMVIVSPIRIGLI